MDVVRPELGTRKRRRQLMVLIVVAAVLLTASLWVVSLGATPPALRRTDVLIETVHRGEFLRAVHGAGKLVPSQTRWVIARTDATVEKVLVRPGTAVRSDAAILELSNPEVQDRLLAAEASYAAAYADHTALRSQMQANLLESESSLAEINGKFQSAQVQEEASRLGQEKGVVSMVQYKQAMIELQQLRVRVRIEEQRAAQSKVNMHAQVVASQARLDQLARTRELRQREADALQVKAGLDGVVQQINVEEGQRVNAGINLAQVARPSTLIAELRIAESQAGDLSPGQPATIEVGGSHAKGKVRRINPVVENGTILVEVELLGGLAGGARSGQSVDGTIFIDRLADTLFVTRPVNSTPGSDATVFRLSGRDRAERVPVQFGKDSVSQIQVLRGLKEGDKVIVSDTSSFDRSAKVSIE